MGLGLWAALKGPLLVWSFVDLSLSFGALSWDPLCGLYQQMWWINLWYGLWYAVVPFFNVLEHNGDRLILPAYVCLVFGVTRFLQNLSHRRQLVVGLLCLFEWLCFSPAPWPTPLAPAAVHPISIAIAEGPTGAVVTFHTPSPRPLRPL